MLHAWLLGQAGSQGAISSTLIILLKIVCAEFALQCPVSFAFAAERRSYLRMDVGTVSCHYFSRFFSWPELVSLHEHICW